MFVLGKCDVELGSIYQLNETASLTLVNYIRHNNEIIYSYLNKVKEEQVI